MYSTEQRRLAIETFIRFDHSYADTIAELGYPDRHTLNNWWREYGETGEVPVGKMIREPRFSDDQKREAVEHYLGHGKSLSRTMRALGYPKGSDTLRGWIDELAPGQRKHRGPNPKRDPVPVEKKVQVVAELEARTGPAVLLGDLRSGSAAGLELGHRLHLLRERDRARFRARPPVLALPGGELVDPAAEALPAGGIAHPAHGPGEALSVREAIVHGGPPHLQGELGLPPPLRGPDLPMPQIVLVPGPERMPRRVPRLRNRVCMAMIESDEGLDCNPSLFGAEHAASFLSRFGPGSPPQSQTENQT